MHLKIKALEILKANEGKNIYRANNNQKKAGMTILLYQCRF